jgi:hypothetical protein
MAGERGDEVTIEREGGGRLGLGCVCRVVGVSLESETPLKELELEVNSLIADGDAVGTGTRGNNIFVVLGTVDGELLLLLL